MANFDYDVFLSHSSKDKPAVEYLAERLEDEEGLRVFLDKWNLIPGEPWQDDLERALDCSKTVAVFLGPSGIGGWHNEEMRHALDQRVRSPNRRVIPVLLPGTTMPQHGQIPAFLGRLNWVDFRKGLDDPYAFRLLVAGIRGVSPGRIKPGPVRKLPATDIQHNSGRPGTPAMRSDISSDFNLRLRNTLLNCGLFESDRLLRAFFIHPQLQVWQSNLPQANSYEERVDLFIGYILNKRTKDGESALSIFLRVLSERYQPADALHQQLADLAAEAGEDRW